MTAYGLALALALGSALAYGASAYISAVVARQFGAWTTNLGEQVGALLILVPIAPFVVGPVQPGLLAAATMVGIGVLLMLCNFASYQLLTLAPVAIVWPILSSNGALISALAIVFLHERIAAFQAAGLGLVVVGVAFASYAPGRQEVVVGPAVFAAEPRRGPTPPVRHGSRPVLLAAALVAAFSGAVFFCLILFIKTLGWYLPIALERGGQVLVAFGLAGAGVPSLRALAGHPAWSWALLPVVGALDGLGLIMYSSGNRIGPTAVVAVVNSSYVVVPVVLGMLLIRERPSRRQLAGVGGVITGLLLVSA